MDDTLTVQADLATGGTQPANPYLGILQADQQRSQVAMRANLAGAVDVRPDVYSQQRQAAARLGYPTAAVEAMPQLQQVAQTQQVVQDAQQSPALQRAYTNADFAKLAHDDSGALSKIQQALLYSVGGQGSGVGDTPAYGDTSAIGDLGRGLEASLAKLSKAFYAPIGAVPVALDAATDIAMGRDQRFTPLSDWYFEHTLAVADRKMAAVAVPASAPLLRKAMFGTGDLGGTLASIYATGGASELPAAGAAVTSTSGALRGMLAHSARAMAVPATADAVNTYQAVLEHGGSAATAARAAAAQYAVTTLSGVAPLSIEGGLATRLGTGFLSGAAAGEASREAMNLVLPENMRADFNSDDLVLSGLMGAGMGGAFGPRASGNALREARATYADAIDAAQAQAESARITEVGDQAAASKLRERDPQVFHQLVEQMADSPDALQAVYVRAPHLEQAIADGHIAPDDLARTMPQVATELAEARATGDDVRIPIADYATHIAGTPLGQALAPHLRTTPDGMSLAEAQDFAARQKDEITRQATALADGGAQDLVRTQQLQAIHDHVLGELNAAGRSTADVNKAYAALARDFYDATSERAGMTPAQLFEARPLRVAGDAPAGAALEQATGKSRGTFSPDAGTISLLKDADLSTFLHESGHHFLETHAHLAAGENAPEGIRNDFDTLLRSFDVAGDTPEARLADWRGRDLEGRRAGHEQFARSFEAYLMEGKAPSHELQGLFSRFRSWLLHIYRSLTNLHVELSPEVRAVMDRMLASDAAIADAEHARGMFALDKAPKGVNDEDFAAYRAAGAQATAEAHAELTARSIRDMRWLSNAKSRALKELQAQAKEARATIRAEVEAAIDESPAFAAKRELDARGLDRADARRQHGLELERVTEDARREAADRKLKGAKATEHIGQRVAAWEDAHPEPAEHISDTALDEVAMKHGFDSSDEMLRAVDAAGNREDVIAAATDQQMLERHGELTDPQSIERAAEAAIHNEARARMMATGLKMLTHSPVPARDLANAAREAAESAVSAKRVRDLYPARYAAAEKRANREVLRRAPTDVAAAAEAQREALLNNQLYRAASDAVDEVAKGLKYLKRFDKAQTAGNVGAEYMDRINELLAAYDITNQFNTRSDVEARRQMREWLNDEYARTGVMPEVSDALLDFSRRRHWSELRVEEFRGLVDAVRSLEHVGREQTSVMIEGKRQAVDEWVAEAMAGMSTLPHHDPVDVQPHLQHATGLDKINARWLSLKGKVRSMDAALLKMEQLFQILDAGNRAGLSDSTFGAFSKVFSRMTKAESDERSMRADATKALRALGDQLRQADVDLNEHLSIPELPRRGRGADWYREELIAAALNTGNASNLKKLAEGYDWNPQVVLHAIDRHLSKPERDFVQGVWDAMAKYGPDIVALQKRLTGLAPKMIEPQALQTQHGAYAGGYYPVVYDAFRDSGIETKNERAAAQLFENNFARPATSKGHTVERTGYVGPLHLSLGVIGRHIDQVTHDLAYREAIIDANRLLSDDRIHEEIGQTMGREYAKQLRPWLQALANDKVFNSAGDAGWESFYRKARANMTMVGLGYRLSTMEIHGLSALSTSIGEIGTRWFAKGAAQFSSPDRWRNAVDFVFERSPEMANRMNEVDRNVHEAIDEVNRHAAAFGAQSVVQRAVDGARKYAFYGVSMLDMASAMPTWYGAYLKAMAHTTDGGLGLGEQEAVEYANRAVRNAHGGGGAKDLAAIQRSKGAMSLATMFYSFWNHMYNRQRDLMRGWQNLPGAVRQGTGTRDFARLLARSWWYFVVPQMIHAALKSSPNDQKPDSAGNKPGTLAHFLHHVAAEIAVGFVSGVPVLRDLAAAVESGRHYAISPLEQAGQSLVQTVDDAEKAAKGKPVASRVVKDVTQAIGYTFGLPTGQASNALQFLWDVHNGDANPHDVKAWFDGLTTGKAYQ